MIEEDAALEEVAVIEEDGPAIEEESRVSPEKQRLRALFKEKTAEVSAQEARRRSRRVAEFLLDLPEMQAARGVFSCLSFGIETDTWDLLDELRTAGKEIYVPRAVPRTRELTIHPYPCELKELSFGLRQPTAASPRLPPGEIDRRIDVALVLGLAFDDEGFRLGYGGGYFDRFLAGRPFPAAGLAFDVQRTKTLPRETHDVPMDFLVTESGVFRPAPGASAQNSLPS